MKNLVKLLPIIFLLSLTQKAFADDYVITLSDKKFSPLELTIPANVKVKVLVKNLDDAPTEFESSELNREKIIDAKSDAIIYLGPLEAGKYSYYDDFNRENKAFIIVK